MFLTVLDLVLILALFIFIAFGFVKGLIQSIGTVVGVFAGAYLANLFFGGFADFLTPILFNHGITAKIISFILIFTITNQLVGLIFYIIGKIFNLIAIIPFLKSFNRLFGGIFGLIEGVLVLGLILIFLSNLEVSLNFIQAIDNSIVAKYLMMAAGILLPLIPAVILKIKQTI